MSDLRLLAVFFASGAAALVYEVLWQKELGLLFGATAPAAATTLAVFFLGLAAGAFVWGRRAAGRPNPLRTYALLEAGIAATALLYFLLLDLYRFLYGPLFALCGDRPGLFLAMKLVLALGILFPPAFFLGGTLPVLGELLVRRPEDLGKTATVLYAINTAGAAAGAFAAGFYLPPVLGFRRSYLLAIATNVAIAAAAWVWSRSPAPPAVRRPEPPSAPARAAALVTVIAAASGFSTLALEVLWTRMYAQVLQNSVYTFAAVLTVFLIALGCGSALAHLLCRTSLDPPVVLGALLSLAGLAVALTPFVFDRQTGGDLAYLHADVGFSSYVGAVFGSVLATLAVPGILVGSVFPYLLKLAEQRHESAAAVLGRLTSVNTFAAIAGSLAAGFAMLELLGLWASIRVLALVYLVAAAVVLGRERRSYAALPAAGVLAVLVLATSPLPAVHLEEGETLVELREGTAGTVAVVERQGDLRIKVNNSYLVGTSRSAPNLRLQSWIPLSLHPAPRSVFYLGMGTGITAGGALDLPVSKVTVSELNGDVVELARRHFGPYLNGLFEDPRVRIVTEDGRSYLLATDERYDVVVADIFLTYKAGTGGLYTREHFTAIRDRLNDGGLFAQWLPAFELTEEELGRIARTLLDVFPRVTLWRRGFSPRFPVLALVGWKDDVPFDDGAFRKNLALLAARSDTPELWLFGIPYAAYAGNLGRARERFESYPVLTDDAPLIEYLSPITNREHFGARQVRVLAYADLGELCDKLLQTVPPRADPELAALGEAELRQVPAGLALYKAEAFRRTGRPAEAGRWLREYERLVGSFD